MSISRLMQMGAAGERDPNFGDVTLLLHGDGASGSTTITDSSSNSTSITVNGNAQIDTAIKKFGTGSLEFDGSGDYLTYTGTNFGTGDFTIEAWVYRNSYPGTTQNFTVICTGNAFLSSTWQLFYEDGDLVFSTDTNFFTANTLDAVGQWVHLAVSRSGTSLKVFENGSTVLTQTVTNNFTDTNFKIAQNRGSSRYFDGYIDDLRITNGVARYTSTFTPPTAPFPNF